MKRPAQCAATASFSAVILLIAYAVVAQDDVGSSRQELLNGAVTTERPEVGRFGGCTGTLVHPQFVLSAGHCFGYLSLVRGSGDPGPPIFSIDHADGTVSSYPVERQFAYGWPGAKRDVLLMKLTSPVPASVATPARIATRAPRAGSVVTVMGYGCTDSSTMAADGLKRRRATVLEIQESGDYAVRDTLCQGDSGGPMFIGTGSNAPIFGVNARILPDDNPNRVPPRVLNLFGRLPPRAANILGIVTAWSNSGDRDISMTGWCSASDERLYNADFNGDRQVDRICHNERTGTLDTAYGSFRLVTQYSLRPQPFCRGENSELHLGDFDGDRRTDVMCADTETGDRRILFANPTSAPYTDTREYAARVPFCRHPTAEIHTGDFNGDGRTDVLCHDKRDGRKFVDYAAADDAELFSGSDWSTNSSWCRHDGAELHASDFDGDRLTDLLCHTRPNGALDVQLAQRGNVFPGRNTLSFHEAGFCPDPEDQLRTWDFVGNGRAGLVCLDRNDDGDGETVRADSPSDRAFNLLLPDGNRHWTRVPIPAGSTLRQWYLTEGGVASQPDQRER